MFKFLQIPLFYPAVKIRSKILLPFFLQFNILVCTSTFLFDNLYYLNLFKTSIMNIKTTQFCNFGEVSINTAGVVYENTKYVNTWEITKIYGGLVQSMIINPFFYTKLYYAESLTFLVMLLGFYFLTLCVKNMFLFFQLKYV